MVGRGDVVGYEDSDSFLDVVLEDVLKMFSEKAMIELIKLPTNTLRVYPEKFSTKTFTKGKKLDKIAFSSTLDLEANEIVKIIVKGDVKDLKKVLPVEEKIIKPLYLFLDKEVLLYAQLRKLKFKVEKNKKTKLSQFIEELEKKHPEIKRAIVKSYLKLYKF
ncbi:hypothetical protein KAJ87_04005 [Candidatus Pacearchaeota archaeon]|nr:hypothetical protein [Candidatus Pacearchaeota archaeon]